MSRKLLDYRISVLGPIPQDISMKISLLHAEALSTASVGGTAGRPGRYRRGMPSGGRVASDDGPSGVVRADDLADVNTNDR